ncbi:hypothetical protein ACRAWC_01140 [Leifsonia sp. L25]|uniref:hypothetical protein n=1 Tax=Actinomycetes TaxID=1760 RepID=UPI003D69B9C1
MTDDASIARAADGIDREFGRLDVEDGAEPSVHLATLPDDGPSGVLWGHLWRQEGDGGYGVLPW